MAFGVLVCYTELGGVGSMDITSSAATTSGCGSRGGGCLVNRRCRYCRVSVVVLCGLGGRDAIGGGCTLLVADPLCDLGSVGGGDALLENEGSRLGAAEAGRSRPASGSSVAVCAAQPVGRTARDRPLV